MIEALRVRHKVKDTHRQNENALRRSGDANGGRRSSVCCGGQAWILAAAILGSSMAFIDSTVVNVALPALQASFQATVVDLQWVVES